MLSNFSFDKPAACVIAFRIGSGRNVAMIGFQIYPPPTTPPEPAPPDHHHLMAPMRHQVRTMASASQSSLDEITCNCRKSSFFLLMGYYCDKRKFVHLRFSFSPFRPKLDAQHHPPWPISGREWFERFIDDT